MYFTTIHVSMSFKFLHECSLINFVQKLNLTFSCLSCNFTWDWSLFYYCVLTSLICCAFLLASLLLCQPLVEQYAVKDVCNILSKVLHVIAVIFGGGWHVKFLGMDLTFWTFKINSYLFMEQHFGSWQEVESDTWFFFGLWWIFKVN